MEVLTITISAIALLLSGISLFFQFFYHPRRIRAVTMPADNDGRTRFGICNAGKESIYITGISVNYSIECSGGMTMQHVVSQVQGATSIVNPGSIVEFSYVAKDPSEQFLKNAPESLNFDMQPERKVDIVVFIQFAFPDGKVFSNWFKSGSYSVATDTRSHSVYGVNIDLLKSALPVLNKKI